MEEINTSASFPEGFENLGYSSLKEVNDRLRGRKVESVEFVDCCTIRFVMDDGVIAQMTPGGIEGDDLEISINQRT